MSIYGDTSGSVDAEGANDASVGVVMGANGPSRVWIRRGDAVLYSPFQYRKRHQPSTSSSSTSLIDDSEDEEEEEFYTPDQGQNLDMDVYSSDVGGYSGDSNMSSEVDDDMDFYAVESSQPQVTAGAVRSIHPLCPLRTMNSR